MLLPVEWSTSVKVIRKTSRRVLSGSLGRKVGLGGGIRKFWNVYRERLARSSGTLRRLKGVDRSTKRCSIKQR